MDRTWPAGLVKLTAMESMGGIPSGESCMLMVRDEEVERREEVESGSSGGGKLIK